MHVRQERNLNLLHKESHLDAHQTKKAISNHEAGMVQILPPPLNPSYMREKHMPLSKTPRLDLYFTHSELTTFSLLAMACMEYLCKNENKYCFLHFAQRPLCQPPPLSSITQSS